MTRRISAIEPQQNNPRRINLYLDGEFAFGLSTFVAAWLQVGQELSDEKIAELKNEDEGESAYQKAIHYISYRPRSSEEVRQNLAKRGIPQDKVEETLTRLQQAGQVDDLSFAQAWVENRNTFHPRSKSALRSELRRKGLEDEVVSSVLDEHVDEQALVIAAARKYARRLSGSEWVDFRKKLSGYLSRRGFSYSTLSPVVSEVWKEIQTADDGDKS